MSPMLIWPSKYMVQTLLHTRIVLQTASTNYTSLGTYNSHTWVVYPQSWPIFVKNLDLLAMHSAQWVPGGRPSLHCGFMQRQYSLHQVAPTYHSIRFTSPHCQTIGKSGWMVSWWGPTHHNQRSLLERFVLPTLKAFKKLHWNGGAQ